MKAAQAARPTSRMSSTDRKSGFTLIEVMAVMLIIALIGTLVVTITPGSGRAKLKALTMQTAALLRRERLGAIMTGHDRRVSLDEQRRAVVGEGGDLIPVPPDIAIDVLGANESWSGRLLLARFHPDGASSGAVLRFSREGAAYEVRVNWYTGGVAIVTP
jgi:general secretion pathway protein H